MTRNDGESGLSRPAVPRPVTSDAPARPRVLLLSRQGAASLPAADLAALEGMADVRARALPGAPAGPAAADLLTDVDVLAATNACLPQLDARLLDRSPRLRRVVLYATGTDHLDLDLLHQRGIALDSLPDYATTAVAEHAIALLLALATRLHLANDRSRGLSDPDVSLRGVELAGRTLGVIGLGRIGGRVAATASALGMDVVANDPHVPRLTVGAPPLLERLDLIRRSDAVAVCCSRRLGEPPVIGRREIGVLRRDALVVNVSRPTAVDTQAMLTALRAQRVRGYAVDDTVADRDRDADLLREGRLLQTGHSAWWRDEVLDRGARAWAGHILAAVRAAIAETASGEPDAALVNRVAG